MIDITRFHIQYGYYVRVTPLGEGVNGCMASFPANYTTNSLQTTKTYVLCDDPCRIELFITSEEGLSSKVIEVTKSNIRLLVLEDIFLHAISLSMSKELIMVEDCNKNLFEMLEIPQTQKEKDLETQLCVKFRELLAGNVVASDIEGCEQLLSCFENGGL